MSVFQCFFPSKSHGVFHQPPCFEAAEAQGTWSWHPREKASPGSPNLRHGWPIWNLNKKYRIIWNVIMFGHMLLYIEYNIYLIYIYTYINIIKYRCSILIYVIPYLDTVTQRQCCSRTLDLLLWNSLRVFFVDDDLASADLCLWIQHLDATGPYIPTNEQNTLW